MQPPTQLVIFGASGDLTRRKLVPALARLVAEGQLKGECSVVGVARRPKTDEEFRHELAEALDVGDRSAFHTLAPRVHYHQGDAKERHSLHSGSRRFSVGEGTMDRVWTGSRLFTPFLRLGARRTLPLRIHCTHTRFRFTVPLSSIV